MEKTLYMLLLAAHNIAAVLCVAAPFYMSRISNARSKYDKRVIYDMDRLMEDVITTQPQICWAALITLVITGSGFPFVHYLFYGAFKELTMIGWIALAVKLSAIGGMAFILYWGTFIYNPRLKDLFAKFEPDSKPDPDIEQEFFALRKLRKFWCERCWNLGLIVLVATAILRWS
jgi:uncharacterized membrane protein